MNGNDICNMKRRILVFSDYYLPGYKAGGPIKSIASIVEMLGDDFSFYVVTSAKDLGEVQRYEGIKLGEWVKVGKGHVFYTDSGLPPWNDLMKLLSGNWSCVYLNSFFSSHTIKVLLALGMLRNKTPVLLAPRGEFSPGALNLKRRKKQCYLAVARLMGYYDRVCWHASTPREQSEISAYFPLPPDSRRGPGRFFVAGNLSTNPGGVANPLPEKQSGQLRVAFLSRVARKKNLHYALKVLSEASGSIAFDIWGPLEDQAYWHECQAIIETAPTTLQVIQKGPIESKDVVTMLGKYHLFLFPTLGENFGHVILEAMAAGCAILISDATPWRGLQEKGYGWEIPLSRPESFVAALNEAVSWDAARFAEVSAAARTAAAAYLEHAGNVDANRSMFAAMVNFSSNAA